MKIDENSQRYLVRLMKENIKTLNVYLQVMDKLE